VPPQLDAPDGKGALLGLRKLGAGTLTLDVPNTYRRNTRIESGTVKVGVADAIPWGRDRGNLDFRNDNYFPRGTLDMNGRNVNVNGILGAGIITNKPGGPLSLTFGNENRTETALLAIAPDIKAVKTGTGTQTLRTGSSLRDLTVQQGTLAAGAGLALHDVALSGGGATLRAGISAADTRGLTGEYYYFDRVGLWGTVYAGRMNTGLQNFAAFLDSYVPWTTVSSASFGEGFDAGDTGQRFQDGFNNRNVFFARWTGLFHAEMAQNLPVDGCGHAIRRNGHRAPGRRVRGCGHGNKQNGQRQEKKNQSA
jgi:autotransporter-associated beta strand protein